MHLFRMLQPDGRFIYAHEPDDPEALLPGYNMLRHCGALWFMLTAANTLRLPLLATEARALSAGVSYAGVRMKPISWAPGLALLTKGEVKLGGIGLSLLMLAEGQHLAGIPAPTLPDSPKATMDALCAYILSQEKPGTVGDFHHKRAASDGKDDGFHSDYYTGEALFGLITAGAPAERTAPIAHALMQRGYGIDVQSHWMAYAACAACDRGLVPEAEGRDYLQRLLQSILADTAYRDRQQSTPIACRSEALARLLLLDKHHPDRFLDTQQRSLARDALMENLALQLRWFKRGQFRKGDASGRVQIDYIQHNAMAFLGWALLHA